MKETVTLNRKEAEAIYCYIQGDHFDHKDIDSAQQKLEPFYLERFEDEEESDND